MEQAAPLLVTIVSAAGLAKADLFGKSDPFCVLYFMDEEIGSTNVISNSLDPIWYNSSSSSSSSPDYSLSRFSFEIPLGKKFSKPVLRIEVYDSDLPSFGSSLGAKFKRNKEAAKGGEEGKGKVKQSKRAKEIDAQAAANEAAFNGADKSPVHQAGKVAGAAASAASSAIKTAMRGDFLGQIIIEGQTLLHPRQNDVTPPSQIGNGSVVLGDTYELQIKYEKPAKFNKLVQGSITIGISRDVVDKQIKRQEDEEHRRHMTRQKENEALLHLKPPTALVITQRANNEGKEGCLVTLLSLLMS
jgi:hypothetical protein